MARKTRGKPTTLEEQTKSTEVRPADKRETMAFWNREIGNAKDRVKAWHGQAVEIVNRYLDERADQDGGFRLNLFHANTSTMEALMYANLPKAQVARRYLDANDDGARIAATIIERILNADLQENGRERDAVLRACLQDRLLSGMGVARVRYTFDTEEVPVPDPMTGMPLVDPLTGQQQMMPKVVNEQAPIDYWYWQDVLWGWGRSWAELPWIAYRSFLSKDEVRKRFPGKEDKLEYAQQPAGDEKDTDEKDSPHHKAEIWEIWDKEGRCIYWYHHACSELLDHKDDPLKLTGFFPSPPFLVANPTTMLYKPTPDFTLYQDLYNEIDTLQTRINVITEAIKVIGVYDGQQAEIGRMFKEGDENTLIPVDSWVVFAEKGGLKGTIDWYPVGDVVSTLRELQGLRNDTIGLLQRTTGMNDVMSGQVNPYEGVAQSELKTAWGSVRVQSLQDQFAQFVSNLLQLQAEVICSQFEPQTILERANVQYMMEPQQNIQLALELLRSPARSRLRVEVKAEAVAQVDQHRVQLERSEFLNALSTFMQSMAPMVQSSPEAMPHMLQMLQWVLSGFRGAAEIEGVLDQAVAQAKEKAKQPKPDPAQQQAQIEMQKVQAKAQADLQVRQADLQADIQTLQAQSQARIQEIVAAHEAKMREIQASGEARLLQERINLEANVAATAQNAAVETDKDLIRIQAEKEADLTIKRAEAAKERRTDD